VATADVAAVDRDVGVVAAAHQQLAAVEVVATPGLGPAVQDQAGMGHAVQGLEQ
jgi:hypothetical protein